MHSMTSRCLNTGQGICARTAKSLLVLLLTGSLVCGSAQDRTQSADGRLSLEARRVLDYLKSIQGNKMLAGHHVMYGRLKERDLGYIVETTGKHPALIEFEAGVFARKYHEDYASLQKQLVADAIAYWKEGGLIAACWHWANPLESRNTYPGTKVKFDIEAAFKEGTPEHQAMIKDLDVTAEMLRELRDANVPVLWRPLHEICGGWFWWSMQGQENAEKLWTFIYRYYTEHHKLDNLIWVYSFSQEIRTDWMPGQNCIDVVSVDIYREGQQDRRKNFDKVTSIAGTRPVALSECDRIPDPDLMKQQGFMWNWFTTWHSRWLRKNGPNYLKRLYNHDLVVTRDELPDLK
ncbi:MAG: glycosyl hydrolase [Planctomycetota bacterium]